MSQAHKKSKTPIGLILGIIIVAVIVIGLIWQKVSSSSTTTYAGPALTLYWGNTCDYCHALMKTKTYKEADKKIGIKLREIYLNTKNSLEFNEKVAICGIGEAGVPMLYIESGECLIGPNAIEDYLITLLASESPNEILEISEEANATASDVASDSANDIVGSASEEEIYE